MARRVDARLATQILLLQLAVVTLTMGSAFALVSYVSHRRLVAEYGTRVLDVARVVAYIPTVRTDVAAYDAEGTPEAEILAQGPLQRIALDVARRTDALFVVITNEKGLRLTHPTISELGKPVSTDPSVALSGREEVVRETGTLGPSVRAKVPVLDPVSDRVVGEVSVGMSTSAIHSQLRRNLVTAALIGAANLAAAVFVSLLLARYWRSLTLGLRPTEMTELVRTQAAVLHGIDEGVLAADTSWNTTFVNAEACRLLGVTDTIGRPIGEIGLTPRILDVFRSADTTPTVATVGESVVVVSARPVTRDGRELGTVLVVRDRTAIESLTRELDAVAMMSTVLRAQRHEFSNQLHLLNGLVQSGHTDEAAQYLEELLGSGPLGSALPGIDAIRDPFLQAFLAAKAAGARDAGVRLRIGANTWVPGQLTFPVDVTTVLGNLVDNAIDAARSTSEALVEVELLQDNSTLHITVADSGSGVAPEIIEHMFAEGTSTKPAKGIPGGRGIGLALSRRIALGLEGDIRLSRPADPSAELPGAEFIARLPGVMTAGDR
jgi:two-component system CitB family sensor kinase